MILDAYRGTVDDEGEDYGAALTAVDDWLSRLEPPHSVVLEQDDQLVAVSFPVATVSWRKREGLGRAAVAASLRSLHEVGVAEVGAVITDRNAASERLFTSLGFVRASGRGDDPRPPTVGECAGAARDTGVIELQGASRI